MAFETLYLQTGETPARLDRWWIDRIFTEGVSDVPAGELLVSQHAGAANLSVDVAAGEAIIDGDDITDQGAYLARSTAIVNVALPAPPASNSRIDLVVLRVRDSTATGGAAADDGTTIEVIEGVAAGAPVAPAVPGTAIPLAQVVVAAGAVAITGANITDRRTQLNATTLQVGVQAEPMTTTQRDALTGGALFEGRIIDNTTTGRQQMRVGAAWVDVGPGAQIAFGTYTGDNAANRLVPLSFAPRFVWLTQNIAAYLSPAGVQGFTAGYGARFSGTSSSVDRPDAASGLGRAYRLPALDTAGFRVGVNSTPATNDTNYTGTLYQYVAIG